MVNKAKILLASFEELKQAEKCVMKEKVFRKIALQSDLDLILLTVYRQRLQGFE